MKGKEIKPHIGILGRRNIGKSSFINALTNQDTAIVSDVPGTTTDPVKKSIELPDIGPVILIDTAGIDDTGELGNKRIQKTKNVILQIDLAIILIANNEFTSFEEELISILKNESIPFFFVHNKADNVSLSDNFKKLLFDKIQTEICDFSSINREPLAQILSLIKKYLPETAYHYSSLVGDLVSYGDVVLLITPIDIEAPEGRLILPQVQVIRDILDNDCVAIVCKERETETFLKCTAIKPSLVITDSSIFLKADAMIPKDIPLTGFSIVLARHKGDFQAYLDGTPRISELKDNDKILILESCTHHVSCDDIGRVKIPRWLTKFTGKKLFFDVVAGHDLPPHDIKDYALVIQCGGCMITRRQILSRIKKAKEAGVPVTNYGMAIAYLQGIYKRAIAPFVKNIEV